MELVRSEERKIKGLFDGRGKRKKKKAGTSFKKRLVSGSTPTGEEKRKEKKSSSLKCGKRENDDHLCFGGREGWIAMLAAWGAPSATFALRRDIKEKKQVWGDEKKKKRRVGLGEKKEKRARPKQEDCEKEKKQRGGMKES